MLQSIQYIGSGPPTYIYSGNATSASDMFFRVFAAETSGYKSQREAKYVKQRYAKHEPKKELLDAESRVTEIAPNEDIQEVYRKEYGRRESFLWKQR